MVSQSEEKATNGSVFSCVDSSGVPLTVTLIKPVYTRVKKFRTVERIFINLLATDFLFQILAHRVFKMRVIQKPNKVAL